MSESVESLSTAIEEADEEVTTLRARVAQLREDVAAQEKKTARLRDRLGEDEDGEALPLGPLIGTLLATTASLFSAVLVYVLWMNVLPAYRPYGVDSDAPAQAGGLMVCIALGVAGIRIGRRSGAGGSARALLRPVAVVSIGMVAAAGLVALCYGIARSPSVFSF